MKRKYLPLALLLLAACDKSKSPDMKAPMITGILYRNDMADSMGQYGVPDVHIGDSAGSPVVLLYPNPAMQAAHVDVKPGPPDTMRVFVVPARFDKPPADAVIANTQLFANADTVIDQIIATNTSPSARTLNVSTLPAGFYRIYFRSRTKLYYDNMQIVK